MLVSNKQHSLTLCGDFAPRICRIHEAGILDLIRDFLVLVERKRSTQAKMQPPLCTVQYLFRWHICSQ